jgi:hypothetical protein
MCFTTFVCCNMSMGTSLLQYRLSCYGESWVLLDNQPQCLVLANALDSFLMAPTSMLIICYVFDNHHLMWRCIWMYLWMCPFHAITSLLPTWHLFWFRGTSWTPFHRCYEVVVVEAITIHNDSQCNKIYMEGVWQPLYAVDGNMNVSLSWYYWYH